MINGLAYYIQTAQTKILAEECDWHLETLTHPDKLQLLLYARQTLHWYGKKDAANHRQHSPDTLNFSHTQA